MNTAHPDFDVLATSQSQHHAIVIGSGFGGMASAIRLAAKGYRVTLLEKLDALVDTSWHLDIPFVSQLLLVRG